MGGQRVQEVCATAVRRRGAAADVLLPRGLEADGSPPPCLCLSI